MIDLQDIAEEVLVGDLPERLLDCKNYIDTVRGQSMRVDYGEINSSFKIFPNPSSGMFSVELPDAVAVPIEIEIFSMSGMKIYESTLWPDGKEIVVPASSFPEGLYMVSIRQNNQVWRERLMNIRD
jgi:hypothetical protein